VSVVNHRDVVISIGKRLIEQGDNVIALYFLQENMGLRSFLIKMLKRSCFLGYEGKKKSFFDRLVKNSNLSGPLLSYFTQATV